MSPSLGLVPPLMFWGLSAYCGELRSGIVEIPDRRYEKASETSPNQSLHRSPGAPVTQLARATRAPAAGAGELRSYAP